MARSKNGFVRECECAATFDCQVLKLYNSGLSLTARRSNNHHASSVGTGSQAAQGERSHERARADAVSGPTDLQRRRRRDAMADGPRASRRRVPGRCCGTSVPRRSRRSSPAFTIRAPRPRNTTRLWHPLRHAQSVDSPVTADFSSRVRLPAGICAATHATPANGVLRRNPSTRRCRSLFRGLCAQTGRRCPEFYGCALPDAWPLRRQRTHIGSRDSSAPSTRGGGQRATLTSRAHSRQPRRRPGRIRSTASSS